MILNASGRCDVCAAFMPWLMHRIQQGYCDIRNPFYPKLVHRILFDQVEAIVFMTKNPIPALGVLDGIPWPKLFHVTVTPYTSEMEPGVPDKQLVIHAIKELSEKLGKDHVIVRYDPILISDRYTVSYHKMMFERLCAQLEGVVKTIIISFVDMKKNTVLHQKKYQYRAPSISEIHELCASFSASAALHKMKVQTCAEDLDLSKYGIENLPCFNEEMFWFLTGNQKRRKKGQRKECACISTVDIGAYNLCTHGCRYCYANYDEKKILSNMKQHDSASSLICGHVHEDDEIRIREE